MENNNHDYVDLGLPSGTLWATCNVGADNPWEYGKYFQWGDTEGYYNNEEYDFSWDSYKWCDGDFDTLTKYNNNSSYGAVDNKIVLTLRDDAANAHMGGNWRLPTKDEMLELVNNTNQKWVTNYHCTGVNGRLFISKKDSSKSIFIPASGDRWNSFVYCWDSLAYLWCSTLYTDSPDIARTLCFSSDGCCIGRSSRYGGYCVRGVL